VSDYEKFIGVLFKMNKQDPIYPKEPIGNMKQKTCELCGQTGAERGYGVHLVSEHELTFEQALKAVRVGAVQN
jgi:hypothetical protein